MVERDLLFRLTILLLVLGVSGCVGALLDTHPDIKTSHDISTGNNSAVIKGSEKGVIEPKNCHIYQPAKTMELVTDAGPVSLVIACFGYGEYGRTSNSFAAIEFVAEAGHTYRFSRTSSQVKGFGGVDVIDITDNKRLVARRPVILDRVSAIENASRAYVFTIFDSAGAGDTRCQIDRSNYRQYFDPGEVNFAVRCTKWSSSFGPLKSKIKAEYEAEITFEAISGHSYAVSIQDKDRRCVQITDVTTNPLRSLFCQPTLASDEHLGKTRVELCAGPKTSCREMTSCAEAMKYMKCGLVGLDGDFDGVPCDSICR